jgi:hypothetical protein
MQPPATAGQPLRIGASDYNAAVEAGRRWRDQHRLGLAFDVRTSPIVSSVVMVRNSTSGTLSEGSVVELSGTPLAALDRRNLVFEGVERTGVDPFCAVLINPLAQLEVGPAVIAGAVIASVNIIDSDNTHARVEVGSTVLKGDFGGWCRILYKPGGTGVKTCVVAVGMATQQRRKARATTTITDNGTGSADVYINGTSKGNVTVSYNWMVGAGNIANGSDLIIEYYHDEDKWVVVQAECAA